MAFSQSKAKKLLKNRVIENTVSGLATTIALVLRDQDYDVNDIELLRWCEFHVIRTTHNSSFPSKKEIEIDYLCEKIRTYLKTWYETHLKWLKSSKSF